MPPVPRQCGGPEDTEAAGGDRLSDYLAGPSCSAECWAGRCCETFSGDVLTELSGVGGPRVIR